MFKRPPLPRRRLCSFHKGDVVGPMLYRGRRFKGVPNTLRNV